MNCKKLISKVESGIITYNEWTELRKELNFNVVRINVSPVVMGFTICKKNSNLIFIESDLSYEAEKETLIHEILHIYNKDFQKGKCLKSKEYLYSNPISCK